MKEEYNLLVVRNTKQSTVSGLYYSKLEICQIGRYIRVKNEKET